MGLKTTLFAVLLVIVISWRNKKIADLEGEKYAPYGLEAFTGILPEFIDRIEKWRQKKHQDDTPYDTM
ncbi:MAG: hypothetical protein K6G10_07050 [Butyrivibrio sp.]|nr:hypothetical protein [Butyrivibrio sp.]